MSETKNGKPDYLDARYENELARRETRGNRTRSNVTPIESLPNPRLEIPSKKSPQSAETPAASTDTTADKKAPDTDDDEAARKKRQQIANYVGTVTSFTDPLLGVTTKKLLSENEGSPDTLLAVLDLFSRIRNRGEKNKEKNKEKPKKGLGGIFASIKRRFW